MRPPEPGSAPPDRRRRLVAVAAAGAGAIGLLGHASQGPLGSWAYWAVLGAGAAWVLVGLAVLRGLPATRPVLGLVIAAGLAARLLLVPLPFLTSTDAYRYLWDGRVQAAGVNPYLHAPAAPAVAGLRDGALLPRINREQEVTIYPPGAQLVFLGAHLTGLRTPAGWKLLLLAAEAAVMVLLVGLLRRGGGDPTQVVAYAWNPVPIIAFGLAGHVDVLVVLAVLAAVWAWRQDRPRLVGAALAVGAAVKLWPLLLAPAFLRSRDGTVRRSTAVAGGTTAAAVLAALYLPYMLGAGRGVLGFLAEGYLREEGYQSGARFQLLRLVGVDDPGWALGLAAALAGIAAVVVLRSRADAAARATWLFGVAVVLATPYPWYTPPLIALAVAGGAGWVWWWLPCGLEAAYLTFFHNVWTPWLGDGVRAGPIRRAAAGSVCVLAALAAGGNSWARAAVRGEPRAAAAPGQERSGAEANSAIPSAKST